MTERRLAGAILAGGRSSRMGGGDKCLHLLSGRPILTHIVERLRPQVDLLALNANGEPSRFAPFGLETIADLHADRGPLAGILAAMLWARKNNLRRVLTVAGDTPFFPADLAQKLCTASEPGRIVQAWSDGRGHPVFALWPVELAEDLASFLSGAGPFFVRAFAGERHPVLRVEFEAERVDPFFNINTPEDLAAAERLAEEALP